MQSYRVSVGLYISEQDLDIADFLNELHRGGEAHIKWIAALLLLDQAGKKAFCASPFNPKGKLPLPTPAPVPPKPSKAPTQLLFGGRTELPVEDAPNNKWNYGWQKRGEHGEVIFGSVINLSFSGSEIVGILNSLKQRHIKVSTYIKSLIHASFNPQPGAISLNKESINDILKTTLFHTPKAPPAPTLTSTKAPSLLSPETSSDTIIDFTEDDPTPPMSKNPLLNYID